MSYLSDLKSKDGIITAIDNGITYPERESFLVNKYREDILLFSKIVKKSKNTNEVLSSIRSKEIHSKKRISLLKIFRRCVSLVCDTEMTKKINKHSNEEIIKQFGDTFKDIKTLKKQFSNISEQHIVTLAVLMGENDDRGQKGYILTDMFFTWFESKFPDMTIDGPRGAGADIELSTVLSDFKKSYPCDFVIKKGDELLAVGFARYDSTRGGAQSDDRTGGNLSKVQTAKEYFGESKHRFKILFVSDGPGLVHDDTWQESCKLDDMLNGDVRVATINLCDNRVTRDWLEGKASV